MEIQKVNAAHAQQVQQIAHNHASEKTAVTAEKDSSQKAAQVAKKQEVPLQKQVQYASQHAGKEVSAKDLQSHQKSMEAKGVEHSVSQQEQKWSSKQNGVEMTISKEAYQMAQAAQASQQGQVAQANKPEKAEASKHATVESSTAASTTK